MMVQKNTIKSGVTKKRVRRRASEIERKWKCTEPTCNRSYGSEGALKLHIRRKHPEEIEYTQEEDEEYLPKKDKKPKKERKYSEPKNSFSPTVSQYTSPADHQQTIYQKNPLMVSASPPFVMHDRFSPVFDASSVQMNGFNHVSANAKVGGSSYRMNSGLAQLPYENESVADIGDTFFDLVHKSQQIYKLKSSGYVAGRNGFSDSVFNGSSVKDDLVKFL
eukprot:TRINITY_DN3259_c0_g2_i1.p1 TRINITY_DN3259_c0_g2~~TRINITY_DN3259_c0_g2_i1.p1  ORF type:complete len:220 (-),score=38.33 TRINITY_DN3259_c0_g2_i1:54-713(-)